MEIAVLRGEIPLRGDGLPLSLFFGRNAEVNADCHSGHIPHLCATGMQVDSDRADSLVGASKRSRDRTSTNSSSAAGSGLYRRVTGSGRRGGTEAQVFGFGAPLP